MHTEPHPHSLYSSHQYSHKYVNHMFSMNSLLYNPVASYSTLGSLKVVTKGQHKHANKTQSKLTCRILAEVPEDPTSNSVKFPLHSNLMPGKDHPELRQCRKNKCVGDFIRSILMADDSENFAGLRISLIKVIDMPHISFSI